MLIKELKWGKSPDYCKHCWIFFISLDILWLSQLPDCFNTSTKHAKDHTFPQCPSHGTSLLCVSQMLLFPGQPPSQSGRYSVSMGGELTIADVHPEDSGFYICQAISVAGSVLTKALLEVEGGGTLRVAVFVLTLQNRLMRRSSNVHNNEAH